ncbi:g10066 [Coccomyxa elongata]
MLRSSAEPAPSLYTIFSPGQLRHGVQPLAHTGSQGTASQEAATLGEAPISIARSDTAETPAELGAKPDPKLRGVPCSRAAAASMEPDWLHDDLDEMLPDGITGPTWCVQPPQVSKASARSAAAIGGTAAPARAAAGPAMVNATDVYTAIERPAVVQHLRSTVTITEQTVISASAGARPSSTMKAAFSTAAAVESPSSPVGPAHAGGSAAVVDRVHKTCQPLLKSEKIVELLESPATGQERAAGLDVAAALTTATPASSQDADRGGFAAFVSTQAAPTGKILSFAPLTSILAKQDSAGGGSTGELVKGGPEQVHGGALEAEVSSQRKKWGSDVAWQHSSIDREDRCSVLDDHFQAACGRCAELEAELAAKDADAQLARSENAELAARCERLDRHLAEARAAVQLISFEQGGLKERCAVLEKEAAGHAASMNAVNYKCDKARSKCDTLEEISAERETCIVKAMVDSIRSRAQSEKLEHMVQEVREEVAST